MLCVYFHPTMSHVVSVFPLQLAFQFPKDEVALLTAAPLVKTVTNLKQVCFQNQNESIDAFISISY